MIPKLKIAPFITISMFFLTTLYTGALPSATAQKKQMCAKYCVFRHFLKIKMQLKQLENWCCSLWCVRRSSRHRVWTGQPRGRRRCPGQGGGGGGGRGTGKECQGRDAIWSDRTLCCFIAPPLLLLAVFFDDPCCCCCCCCWIIVELVAGAVVALVLTSLRQSRPQQQQEELLSPSSEPNRL